MKIIYRPRASGKTFELIKIASEDAGKVIVCRSKIHVNMIWSMAITMKRDGYIHKLPSKPITYQELLTKIYMGKYINEFLIDDADMLLQYLTPIKISTISMSGELETYQDELNKIPPSEYERMVLGKWKNEDTTTDV